MAFDFKKEYKEFYLPKNQPSIVTVPVINYLAVQGAGNPNDENGEYKASIGLLYAIAFTIKMSKKSEHKIAGYFDYVVPPLEGFWWQDGNKTGIDYNRKDDLQFISAIRLPDFVSKGILTGRSRKRRERRGRIFRKWSFGRMMRGLRCSACIWGVMMMS